jgi:hypothetical protein
MKAKIMMGFLLVVLGTAFGVAARSTGPIPPCKPDVNCPALSGEPIPICLPGKPCSAGTKALAGDPIPICLPGKPCSAGK